MSTSGDMTWQGSGPGSSRPAARPGRRVHGCEADVPPTLSVSEDNRRTSVQPAVPISEGMKLAQAESAMNAVGHFHSVEPTLTVPGAVRWGSLPRDPPGCPWAFFFF